MVIVKHKALTGNDEAPGSITSHSNIARRWLFLVRCVLVIRIVIFFSTFSQFPGFGRHPFGLAQRWWKYGGRNGRSDGRIRDIVVQVQAGIPRVLFYFLDLHLHAVLRHLLWDVIASDCGMRGQLASLKKITITY
jgi:hypothetical protein